eukprot:11201333-Lingulodinium_polyedra.AAC.1
MQEGASREHAFPSASTDGKRWLAVRERGPPCPPVTAAAHGACSLGDSSTRPGAPSGRAPGGA